MSFLYDGESTFGDAYLVDGQPPLHSVTEPFEAKLCVRDKVGNELYSICRSESSILFVQGQRSIVVV